MNPSTPAHANGPDTHGGSNHSLHHALARLQASRAALRFALMPPPDPAPAPGTSEEPQFGWASLRRWLATTPLQPLLRPMGAAFHGWWQQHPLRSAGEAASNVATTVLGPWVRRHPWWAVGAAATLGALVAVARPWQLRPGSGPLSRHALVAGRRAGRQVLRSTLGFTWHQLSQPSVQVALASAVSAWLGSRHAAAAASPTGQARGGGAEEAPAQGRTASAN